MTNPGVISSVIGERFRQSKPPTLVTQKMSKGQLGVSLVGCDENLGLTQSVQTQDVYLVGLPLRPCREFHYSALGLPWCKTSVGVGDVMVHNLSLRPVVDFVSPFRSLMFYFSPKTLHLIADAEGAPRFDELGLSPGSSCHDPTLSMLGGLLLPTFDEPGRTSELFVDHVLFAIGAHVAQMYGGMRVAPQLTRAGLAPWQERRAKDLLSSNLAGKMTVSQLAAECGLSVSHFSRAFRKSVGMPPYQWLQQRRIEVAKAYLRERDTALVEVAITCGFADQSHFTRAFTKTAGVSPAVWRRQFSS
jgi:AraC family transcriptional regulator